MKRIIFILIIFLSGVLCSAMDITNLTGKWKYSIHFSTLDGGGANHEYFVFYPDNSFEYKMDSYYYSRKTGNKKHNENYSGKFKIENRVIIFHDVRIGADTRKKLTAKWQILSFENNKLKLKPITSPADGGYERTYVRE